MANIPPMLMTRLAGQLTGSLHNLKMYPASHPTSQKLFEASLRLIKEAMGDDNALSFSLAGNILLINDKPVPDSRKEVFANFISELGKRSVGQLTFKQGVDQDQLQGFFETMAMDVEQVKAKGGLAAVLALRGISNIIASGISYGGSGASGTAGPGAGGSGSGSGEGSGAGMESMLPGQVVAMLKRDPSMVTEMLLKGVLAMADTPEGQEKLVSDLDQLALMAKAQGGGEYASMMANVIGSMDQRSSQMVAQVKLDNPEWSDVVRELLTRYSNEDLAKMIVNKAEALALETNNDPVVLAEKLRGMVASIPADNVRKQTLYPLVQPKLQYYGLNVEDCAFVFGQISSTQPVLERYLADLSSRPAAEMASEAEVKTLRWIIRRDENCKPALEGFLKLLGDAGAGARESALSRMMLLEDDLLAIERFDLAEQVITSITSRLRQESDARIYQRAIEMIQLIADELKSKQRQALVTCISKDISDIMLLMTDKPVAKDMIRILALIGDEAAIRSLILGLLKDPILEDAASALAGIKEKTLPYLLEAVKESEDSNMRFKCMYVLNKIGAGVEEMAIKALADDRWFVRRNMCVLLSLMGTEKSLSPMGALLDDKDPRVRLEGLKALYKIGGQQSEAWLIRAMGDKDTDVKKQAIELAGKAGAEASVDALTELYYKRDLLGRGEPVEIKKQAIISLGALGTRTAATVLMKIARDKDAEMAQTAQAVLPGVLKKIKEQEPKKRA
ncbi:HEAT repeat domain-containing protein [candidate division TA06 bacterium]|uniref:HEAT repeat domain-containing protein n=1 Tax=candidate division TA06 bacterium TaxID=2250710 RepID=A0A933MJZ9_UNCT6|nr:HEAT repeat domain-containing protein [candidate division TA06 bacterium]